MQIETNRLIIREFQMEDTASVHLYASNPEVARYMIWGPNTEEETAEYIKRTIEMQKQEPRYDYEFAVVLKRDGRLIGGCGIHVSEPLQGEIGLLLQPTLLGARVCIGGSGDNAETRILGTWPAQNLCNMPTRKHQIS
ncbi:GNAT family N-acetyltransferase [Paenibacillus sp. J5C2022]|uniref:GNAT family N-acetyltransferase n=1 Tax=Paenibacillus sp. J5C2022 TaxID=2977129 RepID=UPI00293F757B|nr:GNAT family N-acetyltransferase [Paenibacillus sp. J5C2022]